MTLLQTFLDWRDRYLAGPERADPISTARCALHGRTRRLVGFTWRHRDFGILFEGVTRTSDGVEAGRILDMDWPGGGWTTERWLIPLEGELAAAYAAILSRRLIPATCTAGHKVAVDLAEALAATRAGRSAIALRQR
jgi:hypothetical protein